MEKVILTIAESIRRGTFPQIRITYRYANGNRYGPYYEARWVPRKGQRGRTIYLGKEDREEVQVLLEVEEFIDLAARTVAEDSDPRWLILKELAEDDELWEAVEAGDITKAAAIFRAVVSDFIEGNDGDDGKDSGDKVPPVYKKAIKRSIVRKLIHDEMFREAVMSGDVEAIISEFYRVVRDVVNDPDSISLKAETDPELAEMLEEVAENVESGEDDEGTPESEDFEVRDVLEEIRRWKEKLRMESVESEDGAESEEATRAGDDHTSNDEKAGEGTKGEQEDEGESESDDGGFDVDREIERVKEELLRRMDEEVVENAANLAERLAFYVYSAVFEGDDLVALEAEDVVADFAAVDSEAASRVAEIIENGEKFDVEVSDVGEMSDSDLLVYLVWLHALKEAE